MQRHPDALCFGVTRQKRVDGVLYLGNMTACLCFSDDPFLRDIVSGSPATREASFEHRVGAWQKEEMVIAVLQLVPSFSTLAHSAQGKIRANPGRAGGGGLGSPIISPRGRTSPQSAPDPPAQASTEVPWYLRTVRTAPASAAPRGLITARPTVGGLCQALSGLNFQA